jgi:hypothetical protein
MNVVNVVIDHLLPDISKLLKLIPAYIQRFSFQPLYIYSITSPTITPITKSTTDIPTNLPMYKSLILSTTIAPAPAHIYG